MLMSILLTCSKTKQYNLTFNIYNYKDINPIAPNLISTFLLILDEDLGTIKAICNFINPYNRYHI
jgi:hypothetical protein